MKIDLANLDASLAEVLSTVCHGLVKLGIPITGGAMVFDVAGDPRPIVMGIFKNKTKDEAEAKGAEDLPDLLRRAVQEAEEMASGKCQKKLISGAEADELVKRELEPPTIQ